MGEVDSVFIKNKERMEKFQEFISFDNQSQLYSACVLSIIWK